MFSGKYKKRMPSAKQKAFSVHFFIGLIDVKSQSNGDIMKFRIRGLENRIQVILDIERCPAPPDVAAKAVYEIIGVIISL